jgi:uncharacterized membrane protein YphA (DoxX/SURF4 family)
LPAPEVFTYAIGTVELVGETLLVLGLATRLVALGLAGDGVGAIATGGRVDGGFVNLGLAPMLLAAMLFLVWAGAGRFALDELLGQRLSLAEPCGSIVTESARSRHRHVTVSQVRSNVGGGLGCPG